jgi:hypothetical protein
MNRSSNTFPTVLMYQYEQTKCVTSKLQRDVFPHYLLICLLYDNGFNITKKVPVVRCDINSGVCIKLNRYVQLSEAIKRIQRGILHRC